MDSQLYPWKRELWQKENPSIGNWGVAYDVRLPSKLPKSHHKPPASDVIKQPIVTEQAPTHNGQTKSIYPYAFAVGVASGLLLVILVAVFLFSKRRNGKVSKDDTSSASILVYPSPNGGNAPQFLTKEINFSLPPLRSNSLGDLEYQDNPYDSDVDTDALLLPGQSQSTRSNSFSCYGLGVIEPSLYRSSMDLDEIEWPEGHLGRLWFSLRYEPSTEKLLVSLLKAKNLPSRTLATFNVCDPFVRLHLMPDERRYLQSKQKKKTCNPYFDETLVFQVSAKDMVDHVLKLTVIDGGRSKRHAEIGHVTYPLRDLEIGDGSEQQLFKMDLLKEPQDVKSDAGELLVSLVFNENLNRLTATVIEARRLKFLALERISAHSHNLVLDEEGNFVLDGTIKSGEVSEKVVKVNHPQRVVLQL